MTIFSKIIAGEIPSYKVAEDENFYAFLDINPMTKGHTLVVPKKTEENYIFRLNDDTYISLMKFSKKVALAIEEAMTCKRVGVAVIGMEVPHAHVHLIPINKESEMNFSNPKLKLTADEMADIASKISREF
ncbi:MAG: HIT family protein [Paludibacteraceae bacterium]